MENIFENIPHNILRDKTLSVIKNLDRVDRDPSRFTIISSATGTGKSYIQDNNIPEWADEFLPNIKLIIRLSPTRDVATDGTFTTRDGGQWFGNGYKTPKELRHVLELWEATIKSGTMKHLVSMTHGIFLNENSEELATFLEKYQSKILIIIEEAHKFFAVPIAGKSNASKVYGRKSAGAPYYARMPIAIRKWMEKAPYVLGFTATPTTPQTKELGDYNGKLEFVDEQGVLGNPKFYYDVEDAYPQDVKDSIPHQAWVKNTFSYPYKKKEPESVIIPLKNSVTRLLKTQKRLTEFKGFDPNIHPQRVWLGVVGRKSGSGWGASPDFVRENIVEHLSDLNFPNTHCIGDMSASGCYTYDLLGNKSKKYAEPEFMSKLNDPNDPLQFLICIFKATVGLNIPRISEIFVGRVRHLDWSRTEQSEQIYGRGLRSDIGTIILSKADYKNDIRKYLLDYHEKTGIDLSIISETIKLSNHFNITYPEGVQELKTKTNYSLDVWGDAKNLFLDRACNTLEEGSRFLDNFLLENGIKVCYACGQPIINKLTNHQYDYDHIQDSPLNSFFNINS